MVEPAGPPPITPTSYWKSSATGVSIHAGGDRLTGGRVRQLAGHQAGDRLQVAGVAGGHRRRWQPHPEGLADVRDEAGCLDRVEYAELQQRGVGGEVLCVLFTEQAGGNVLGQDLQYVRVLIRWHRTSPNRESVP